MVIVPAVLTTSVVFNLVIVLTPVLLILVVFNLVIVPTPEMLRFLPVTSSYTTSSRTNKSPPT